MARRITNLILLTCFVLGCCWQAIAQPSSLITRSLGFWAYRTGEANWSNIRFEISNGEVATLSLGKFIKSRVHEYEGPNQLVFFREIPDPAPQDPARIKRMPIGGVTIPANVQEAILIFAPSPTNTSTEFSITFIAADAEEFPTNSLRVLNKTGVRLPGKVGQENLYFENGISKPFDFRDYFDGGIPVAFLVETEEGPKFVFEKKLEYAPSRRVILLLQPPLRKGSYKIQVTNLIEVVDE
jgi:hypothetical protein